MTRKVCISLPDQVAVFLDRFSNRSAEIVNCVMKAHNLTLELKSEVSSNGSEESMVKPSESS